MNKKPHITRQSAIEINTATRIGNKPDEPITGFIVTDLKNFMQWDWYDNFQHGTYEDENYGHYGPIKVFNARVVIGKKLEWHGDVSERRLKFLQHINKDFGLEVMISTERLAPAYSMPGDELIVGD